MSSESRVGRSSPERLEKYREPWLAGFESGRQYERKQIAKSEASVSPDECVIIGCNSPRQYGRWCGYHAPANR